MRYRSALAVLLAAAFVTADPRRAGAQTAADLFHPDALHEIRLFINSRDLRELRARYLENTYYTADLQWRNIRVRNVGVRSRGVASRSGTKLALRVDFDRYTSGQRMVGLKSVVLKNLWQDGSMLHERLSMAFFTRMGQAAPRESFARLYINNVYEGLYGVVESVDNDFLSRTLNEDGGYLYSYQFREGYRGEDLGDDLAEYKPMFEPQNHEREADSALYGPIRDLFREVNQPDDGVWRERVEQYVDLPQFVTQAAIESFLAEEDGLLGVSGMNNFFLYRLAGTTRHRFIPWDKDSAFLLPGFFILSRADETILLRRAFGYADLRDLYFTVLEAASRSAEEEGWLEAEIVRLADLIAGAVVDDTRKPFSTEAFFESVEILRDFARRRPALVREQIARIRVP